jgi:hypothetical protein
MSVYRLAFQPILVLPSLSTYNPRDEKKLVISPSSTGLVVFAIKLFWQLLFQL